MAFIINVLVPALAANDRIDLGKSLREGKFFTLHSHSAGLDAAHVKDVVYYVEQMLG